jgi:hypothetical protein
VSGGTLVEMMKAAYLGNRDDAALGGRLDLSRRRRVPMKREMRPRLVVVLNVGVENAA